MKPLIYVAFLLATANMTNLHSQTPARPTISDVAQAYGMQAQDVVNSYNHLFDKNGVSALHAVDSLSSKGAYSALALALPSADATVKPSIVDALSKATAKDNLIISSVSLELGNQNVIVIRQGGEDMAIQHVMKQKLIKILAKQTGINADQVNADNQQQVNAFIASVDAANH